MKASWPNRFNYAEKHLPVGAKPPKQKHGK